MGMPSSEGIVPTIKFNLSLETAQKLGFAIAICATALYMLIDVKRIPC